MNACCWVSQPSLVDNYMDGMRDSRVVLDRILSVKSWLDWHTLCYCLVWLKCLARWLFQVVPMVLHEQCWDFFQVFWWVV